MTKRKIRKYRPTLIETYAANTRHVIAQIDHNISLMPPEYAERLDEERSLLRDLLTFLETRRDVI